MAVRESAARITPTPALPHPGGGRKTASAFTYSRGERLGGLFLPPPSWGRAGVGGHSRIAHADIVSVERSRATPCGGRPPLLMMRRIGLVLGSNEVLVHLLAVRLGQLLLPNLERQLGDLPGEAKR